MLTINLLPEDLRDNIIFSKKNRKVLGLLKVVIILCLLVIVSFFIIGASLINSNSFFVKEIAESNEVIDGYKPVIDEKKKIENKANSIEKIRSSYKYFSKFNYIMGKSTPMGVYISTLETQNDTLKIMGFAKTKNDIGIFRDTLEQTDAFSDVRVESVKEATDPAKEGTTANNFTINANMSSDATNRGTIK